MSGALSRRQLLKWGGFVGAGGVVAGCGSAGSRTGGETGGGGGGSGSGQTAVTLGLLAPLTGPGAGWGPLQADGFRHAIDVLNKAGIEGLDGLEIRLEVLDTETKPDVAAAQAEKLAQDENVVMITGCNQSGASVVVAQVAQRNQIPFVTGTDADPLIVDQGSEFSFRVPAGTDQYPIQMLDWVLAQEEERGLPLRKLAILSSSSQLGVTATEFAVEHANKTGFEIIDVSSYDPTTSDFTPFISRYKSAGVETFIGVHDPQPGVLIIRTMKQQGWQPSIFAGMYGTIGTDDWMEAVGADGDYAYNAFNWVFNTEGADTSAYEEAIRSSGGEPSGSFDGPGAAVVAVLAEALRAAGDTSRTAVTEALRKVDLEQGQGEAVPLLQGGGVRFADNGANEKATLLVAMTKDQELWTVAPKESAVEEPVIPRPAWG